jgi:hypothetical protein
LEQLLDFVKSSDETSRMADPRVSFLGNWVREAIELVKIVTGVSDIKGDDSRTFDVRYNEGTVKVGIVGPAISLEVY